MEVAKKSWGANILILNVENGVQGVKPEIPHFQKTTSGDFLS